MKRTALIAFVVGLLILLPLCRGLRIMTCNNKRQRGIWFEFGRNGPMFLATQGFVGDKVDEQYIGYYAPTNRTKACDWAFGEMSGAWVMQYTNQFGSTELVNVWAVKP